MNKSQQRARVDAMRQYLQAIGHPISSNQGYELLARSLGLKSRDVLAAQASQERTTAPAVPETPANTVMLDGKAIPVLPLQGSPLSVAQMQALNWELDAVVPMPVGLGDGEDIDAFNDRASLLLTGNEGALCDIGYEHVPQVTYPKGYIAVRITGSVDAPEECFSEVAEAAYQRFYAGLAALFERIRNQAHCTMRLGKSGSVLDGHLVGVDPQALALLQQYASSKGGNNKALDELTNERRRQVWVAYFLSDDHSLQYALTMDQLKYAEHLESSDENSWKLSHDKKHPNGHFGFDGPVYLSF